MHLSDASFLGRTSKRVYDTYHTFKHITSNRTRAGKYSFFSMFQNCLVVVQIKLMVVDAAYKALYKSIFVLHKPSSFFTSQPCPLQETRLLQKTIKHAEILPFPYRDRFYRADLFLPARHIVFQKQYHLVLLLKGHTN